MRMVAVRCFKCREEGHKCRECPLWVKKERAVHVAMPQKAYQERRPACPVRGEAQERKLRKVKQEEAARVAKPREAQQKWKRSSWEVLRKRVEWYCGPTVPQDAELWELGWCGQGAVVTYLRCPRCGKGGCYMEDDRGQGVVPYWKREKISWCGCRKEQSGA